MKTIYQKNEFSSKYTCHKKAASRGLKSSHRKKRTEKNMLRPYCWIFGNKCTHPPALTHNFSSIGFMVRQVCCSDTLLIFMYELGIEKRDKNIFSLCINIDSKLHPDAQLSFIRGLHQGIC